MGTDREESSRADLEAREILTEKMRRGEISAWAGWRPDFMTFDDVLSQWRDVAPLLGSPGYPGNVNVYVNIPICASFCGYCMYWKTGVDRVSVPDYVDYLVSAIDAWGGAAGRVDALNCYIGGGTASILPAAGLARVVEALGGAFRFSNERSFEANPASFSPEKLEIVAAGGFNRLSMGVQSLDAAVLLGVGRKNPPEDRLGALVARARGLGMYTNVDLICGLPGQTPESIAADIRSVVSMTPDTITVYRFQPIFAMNQPPDAGMLESAFARGIARQIDAFRPAQWRFDIREDGHPLFMIASLAASTPPFDPGRVYTFMDYQDRQLLGIGPGARSHIFGRSWVTEITPMDSVRGDRPPVFWGTSITPADEALTMIRAGLASSGRVDFTLVDRLCGVRSAALALECVGGSARLDSLEISDDSMAFAAGADAGSRRAILDLLMPRGPADDEASIRGAISAARGLGPLVPPVVHEGIFRRRASFLTDRSEPDQAAGARVRAWRMMTGLEGDGVVVAGASLTGCTRDELVFLSPDSGTVLKVRISRPEPGDCFFCSRHFRVSYVKDGSPLTEGEGALLDEIRKITMLKDP